jgi:hypothetical protein
VEGVPRLNSDWQWEDQEQALLIACLSLIAVVKASDSDLDAETDYGNSHVKVSDSQIMQFLHSSVKELLTSPHLTTASGEVSNYHINLELAHMILVQACQGVLLQIQFDVEGCTPKDHPLAGYAAEHWMTHVRFGEVSSHLHRVMEYLFDMNKPHFAVWLILYDIDTWPKSDATFYHFAPSGKPPAAPLYYTAVGLILQPLAWMQPNSKFPEFGQVTCTSSTYS